MEKGKALQVTSKTSAAGVNDEEAKNEEVKLVMNGFEPSNLLCSNESIKNLPGTGSQVPICFDSYCQTDTVCEEVKRGKKVWILLIALILLLMYYTSDLVSELFFAYLIQQYCPAYDLVCPDCTPELPANSPICTESPSVIKSLSLDQCFEFDSLEITSKKLEFLAEVLNWKPMIFRNIVSLDYIYSYQSCKYFIGVSRTRIYKFSLYQDYSHDIFYKNITSFLLSPDYNCMALHENNNKLILIDFEKFETFHLYEKVSGGGAAPSLSVFSPDSKYLFYKRNKVDKVLVYNTIKRKLIIEFNTNGDEVVNMKASKNLYHLIVKDKKNNVKVFNIENSNYRNLCWNEEMKKNLTADFPEIEELI